MMPMQTPSTPPSRPAARVTADALVYAEKLEPDAIVDIATLTGACAISLGMDYVCVWACDDGVADALLASARRRASCSGACRSPTSTRTSSRAPSQT